MNPSSFPVDHQRTKVIFSTFAILLMATPSISFTQTINLEPTYQLIESRKKVYGRGSYDFRGIGCKDYWFVGHDTSDGPFLCSQGSGIQYSAQKFSLPDTALDGDKADRHECGFMHLDADKKIDMVCAIGANEGKGQGPNEVYRNVSTKSNVKMQRMTNTTGLEDIYGRSRTVEPFRWADGTQGVWITVHGAVRPDGHANINRLFRYNGSGKYTFSEIVEPLVNITTFNNCSRSGDLNGDGLDDLVLCRTVGQNGKSPAPSIILYQNPNNTWRQAELPMLKQQWITAEIEDLNQDGRKDLIVSVSDASKHSIEVYLQSSDGSLPAQPSWTANLTTQANSIAVGDMDGDGRADLYVTQSDKEACQHLSVTLKNMKDTWPDILFHTHGRTDGWTPLTLNTEPQANGCSWLATAAGPGIIHLARGYEGHHGDSYAIRFTSSPTK